MEATLVRGGLARERVRGVGRAGRRGLGAILCAMSQSASKPVGINVADIPARAFERLRAIDAEERELSKQLENPDVASDHRKVRELAMKRSAIAPVAEGFREYEKLKAEERELEAALKGNDADLRMLADEELPRVRDRAAEVISHVLSGLVTSDDRRIGSIMLEVRAGTGGDEAALWAADLLEMYRKYAAKRGWQIEVLEFTPEAAAGGLRNAVASVKGDGAWSELNFEAGVHSVKRVPATEAAGRIHTSTATVAVLPEPEEVDVKIDWANDVEEQATRAQGPGGQNVNKVETAWQIHHKPTGMVIKMMEAKSQQQNRERARRLLMARLYEAELQRKIAERAAARSNQIGSGGRSEKIRTYRWKEGIVADERLPSEYQLRDLLAGDFHELFRDLMAQEARKRLAAL